MKCITEFSTKRNDVVLNSDITGDSVSAAVKMWCDLDLPYQLDDVQDCKVWCETESVKSELFADGPFVGYTAVEGKLNDKNVILRMAYLDRENWERRIDVVTKQKCCSRQVITDGAEVVIFDTQDEDGNFLSMPMPVIPQSVRYLKLCAEITDLGEVFQLPEHLLYFETVSNDNALALLGTASKCLSGVETAVFPKNMYGLGPSIFAWHSALRNVVLPENLQVIPPRLFYHCGSLSNVTLPVNTKSIGVYAFAGTGLKEIDLSNVESIDCGAFQDCLDLQTVYFGDMSKFVDEGYISEGSFMHCWKLHTVDFTGKFLPTIPQKLFKDCGVLQDFDFEGVEAICMQAFAGCGFTSVRIPESMTEIQDNAFADCKLLTVLDIAERSKPLLLGKSAFARTGVRELDISCDIVGLRDWTFSESALQRIALHKCSSIPMRCFSACKNLSDVLIEATDDLVIHAHAFAECESLEQICLPYTMDAIRREAFRECKNLKSVRMPYSIQSIAADAFRDCLNARFIVYENSYAERFCREHGYPYSICE